MYEDLAALAETLATMDPGKPKQAHLRRAVSTIYYAVFHFLIEEACRTQLGGQHAQKSFRRVIGRAYSHSVMKQACNSFAGGTLKAAVSKGLPTPSGGQYVIPIAIRELAEIFCELQEKRHLADYDLGETFKRTEVLWLNREVRKRIPNNRASPANDDRSFFLFCLWAWKELANR